MHQSFKTLTSKFQNFGTYGAKVSKSEFVIKMFVEFLKQQMNLISVVVILLRPLNPLCKANDQKRFQKLVILSQNLIHLIVEI